MLRAIRCGVPRYSFRCHNCDATCHRIVPIEDRDKQYCAALLDVEASADVDTNIDARPDFPCIVQQKCGFKLRREEISDGGRMSYDWSKWNK